MKDFPVIVRFPMHWGEMDALGHANNTRYFTWFETARIAYFERLGFDADPRAEVGPILKHIECEYVRPVVYPAEIVVGVRVTRIGNTSFAMEHVVTLGDDPETVVARGGSVIVTVNYRTGEALPVPDDVRQAIEALEGEATGEGMGKGER